MLSIVRSIKYGQVTRGGHTKHVPVSGLVSWLMCGRRRLFRDHRAPGEDLQSDRSLSGFTARVASMSKRAPPGTRRLDAAGHPAVSTGGAGPLTDTSKPSIQPPPLLGSLHNRSPVRSSISVVNLPPGTRPRRTQTVCLLFRPRALRILTAAMGRVLVRPRFLTPGTLTIA